MMKKLSKFNFSATLIVCILYWVASTSLSAQTFPVDTIIKTGSLDDRINFVFLSDGYTSSELSTYISDVNVIITELLETSPFSEYSELFNFFAVKVPSNESGADHPGTASDEPGGVPIADVDNYFGCTFDYGGIHRLLVCLNSSVVSDVLADNFPAYDQTIIVVNSSIYGGSGGTHATVSTHASSAEIAIHEIGHSFANLADEYDFNGGTSCREKANTTAETDRSLIRWNIWINDTTTIPTPEISSYNNVVGLFEGASYNTVDCYRPKNYCKMRVLGYDFCEVCTQEFIEIFHDLTTIIENYSPIQISDTLDSQTPKITFNIDLLKPNPNTLHSEWLLDGSVVATDTSVFIFDTNTTSLGLHTLSYTVVDTITTTRDPDHLTNHKETLSWDILNGCIGPTANFNNSISGLTVIFENTSVKADSYSWVFGDGNTDSSSDPTHTYSAEGTYTVCLSATNNCTIHKKCESIQLSTSGSAEEAIKEYISIYPNPGEKYIYIDVSNSKSIQFIRIEVLDMLGKKVFVDEKESINSIYKIENLDSGVYFATLYSVKSLITKKIIIR